MVERLVSATDATSTALLAEGVEKAVLTKLSEIVRDDEAIDKASKWLSGGNEPAQIGQLRKIVAELERKAENVMKAVENGAVDFAPRYREFLDQIESKKREIRVLRESATGTPPTKRRLVLAFAWMSRHLQELDRAGLRSALRKWVGSVALDIKKRHLTMTYAVPRISEGARNAYCGGWI